MIRKPFQSKLVPHLAFIRECRAKGMSYSTIADELRRHAGLSAAPSTIFAFVKVRARRRTVFTLPAPEKPNPVPAPNPAAVRPSRSITPRSAPASNWLNYDPTKPLEKLSS